jgi:hypothetical protein
MGRELKRSKTMARELVWKIYAEYIDKHGFTRKTLYAMAVPESQVCDRAADILEDDTFHDITAVVAIQGARRETLRFTR